MAEIPAEQQQHRDAFGRAITIWMKHNGWSQQTLHDLSAAAGFVGGVYNSQVSLLQRGRLDPKPMFWVALGQLNAFVAAGDLAPITNRNLRDRLTDAEPFITDEGDVAAASEMFAMFIGQVPLPERYAISAVEPITDKEAKKLSEELRKQFRATAQAQMLSPAEAWAALEQHCAEMSADQQVRFREVLSGWSDFSGEEATTFTVPGQPSKPSQALSAWAA
jgi:hypothetical protein